ncbi:MAG: hypothetical protein K2X47_04150 [Bdellovibrionales bacterium]|nr:hypothetical protein [Bdellovibrionales bacterium]
MKTQVPKLTLRYVFAWSFFLLPATASVTKASDLQTRVSRNVILQNLLNDKNLQTIPTIGELGRTRLSPTTESVVLAAPSPNLPPFRLFIKSPLNTSVIKKVVLIIPGMATEVEKLVDVAPAMKETILIAFDFYLPWTTVPESFIRQVQEIPFQLALALAWMHKTYRVPISILSVSLGTFFHPAAVGFFQRWRLTVDSHVFAFGGADFAQIAKSFGQSQETLDAISRNSGITQFIDPRFFLPIIKGNSMFLEAEADEIFSLDSRNAYFAEIPTPKERVQVPGGHLNQNQPWAIFTALQTIFKFLNISPEAPPSIR